MDFDRQKVLAAFLAESEEGLERTEQALVAAENNPDNLELVEEMFRVAHTIKGNASALEFPVLAGFAHVLEDLLEAVRNREITFSRDVVSLMLQAVDALRALVPAAAKGNDRLSPTHQELKDAMLGCAGGGASASKAASMPLEVSSPTAVPGRALPLNARNRTLRVGIEKLD